MIPLSCSYPPKRPIDNEFPSLAGSSLIQLYWFENEVCKGLAEGPDDSLPFLWALLSSLQHGSARSKHLG